MRDQLLAALELGGCSLDELLADLTSGRALMWRGERSVLVTQVNERPGLRNLHVWLAGGSMREILTFIPGIFAWARAQGCTEVTIDGRKGWARVLAPHGFSAVDGELRRAL